MTAAALRSSEQRSQVLGLVLRHGFNATAFQTLESGYRYWFAHEDACVAYVDTGRAWVAAGAPIAASGQLGEVARGFAEAARAAGRRSCFFAVEQRCVSAAESTHSVLPVGEQPVWDPASWPETLRQHRSLREQLRRARARGVRVRTLDSRELAERARQHELGELIERWLATRGMAPMQFLVRVEPFTFPRERRSFVAELDGRIVGFAGVVPVPAREGWFVEDLIRDPRAPNGTVELLVDAVMRWASEQGCRWLTLGMAPLAGQVGSVLRLARRASVFYDFEGVRSYKAKLRPLGWSPLYLTFPREQGALVSMLDVLAAFAGGSLWRFALRSVLRGGTFAPPRPVVASPAPLMS